MAEWLNSPTEAVAQQKKLSKQVVIKDKFSDIGFVAGVDVGFEQQGRVTRAAIVVMNINDFEIVDVAIAKRATTLPYIPGLLSFRELPAVMSAFESLKILPDMVFCDGHGIAHPRRFGIACHFGVLTGIPAIGIGKSRLVGTYSEPENERGAQQPLVHKNTEIGAVLRTRVNVKPVFVSPGHKVSVASAVSWALRCTGQYKLPEPVRWAHKHASELR